MDERSRPAISRSARTLVVSDVHLCDVAPDSSPRLAYRRRERSVDDALGSLFKMAIGWARGSRLDVVFNGDVFDMDAPAPHADGPSLPPCETQDETCAVRRIHAILDDHPAFVSAVRTILRVGHRAIFVAGNHDAQLTFPAVRSAILSRLGASPTQVLFRSLFHRTPDGVHVEHGHQYDAMCSHLSPVPWRDNGALRLERTVGRIASYYIPALMGCVNPHGQDPFEFRVVDLLTATKQCTVGGADDAAWHLATLADLARQLLMAGKDRPPQNAVDSVCHAVSAETGAHRSLVAQHARLFAAPASAASLLDRKGSYGEKTERSLHGAACNLARLYNARAVVMGHTHVPRMQPIDRGITYGNTGSWAADTNDGDATGCFAWIASSSVSICRFTPPSNGLPARAYPLTLEAT